MDAKRAKKNIGQSAFSFMESPSVKRASGRPQRMLEVRGTRGKPSGTHWLDAMLGAGSVAKARRGTRQVLESNARLTRPSQPRVRTPTPPSQGRRQGRGWIRVGLAAGLLLWSVTVIRPVQRVQVMVEGWKAAREGKAQDQGALPRPAEGPGEADAALPDKSNTADLTPVIPGLAGGAVALWQGASGRWYQVDTAGNLKDSASPSGAENLALPVLTGVGTRKVADGDRVVLRLDSDPKLLAALLPLEGSLAAEIEKVDMNNPRNPVLVTFDGITAPLGEGEYRTKQERLMAVLLDLSAKKRRAASVDMRYSNGAVVKLRDK
jgi:hypothetical protein